MPEKCRYCPVNIAFTIVLREKELRIKELQEKVARLRVLTQTKMDLKFN